MSPLRNLYGDKTAKLVLRTLRLALANPALPRNAVRDSFRKHFTRPRDIARGDGVSAPPVNVKIHPTRRCNLSCEMCVQHKMRRSEGQTPAHLDPARERPPADWAAFIAEIARFRPTVLFIGGEPLMYAGLPEVMAAAKNHGLPVHVQTNGILLRKRASELLDAGLDWLILSIDGPPHVHDRIRGLDGAFRQTMDGIRALAEERDRRGLAGPVITVNCTMIRSNLDHLLEVEELLRREPVDALQFSHAFYNWPENVARHNNIFPAAFNPTLDEPFRLLAGQSILDDEYYENEIASDDAEKLKGALAALGRNRRERLPLAYLPNLPEEFIDPYYLDQGHLFGGQCSKLYRAATVLPDGAVQSCFQIDNGNVFERPFLDIWNGPSMRNLRRIIDRKMLPGCARCCARSFR